MISVTKSAAEKINEAVNQQGMEGKSLRIGVFPGGCSGGYQYALGFDAENDDDSSFESEGLKLIVNSEDIDKLKGLYEWVNIKLDKTGGLTEACNLAHAAQDRGFNLMVGCMVGTSLAMAPATLLGSYAKVVDLDGPLLLAEDRPEGLRFDDSYIYPPDTLLWG